MQHKCLCKYCLRWDECIIPAHHHFQISIWKTFILTLKLCNTVSYLTLKITIKCVSVWGCSIPKCKRLQRVWILLRDPLFIFLGWVLLSCPGVQSICPPFLSPGVCCWTESAPALPNGRWSKSSIPPPPPPPLLSLSLTLSLLLSRTFPTLHAPQRETHRETCREREEGKQRHSGRQLGKRRKRCWLSVFLRMTHLIWQNSLRGNRLQEGHAKIQDSQFSSVALTTTDCYDPLTFVTIFQLIKKKTLLKVE